MNPAEVMEPETATGKEIAVLLVEDEADQASLIQGVLHSAKAPYLVRVVESGEKAIAYLSGEAEFADRRAYPFPALMLLDLRMHGIGGFGVLRWLQGQAQLRKKLIVVVLSVTQSSKEIDVVYELGAHSFWPKSDFNTLSEKMRSLEESWLGLK